MLGSGRSTRNTERKDRELAQEAALPSHGEKALYLFSIAARTRATVSAGVWETRSTRAATCSPVSGSTSILDLSASARDAASLTVASEGRRTASPRSGRPSRG